MIIINVKLLSIEVSKFTREELTLKINFDDGSKKRFIEKKTTLDNIPQFVEEVLADIKKMEKELNAPRTGDFLEDVVIVRLQDDDEDLREKMESALRRVKEEGRKVKSTSVSDNYLQKIALMQGFKIEI
jgi:hypothetical protein